ncbi:MAG TPA: hypothetical protein VHK86_03005 [Nitrososphaera sp.]|jgi:hypothetical protein|nr:hypothetical protein [Nitrososphaera sp.]
MTEEQPKATNPKRKKIGVVVAAAATVIVVGLISNAFVANNAYTSSGITMSGNVNTVGYRTHPVTITFLENSGQRFGSSVSDYGYYELQLPNGDHSYSIEVGWQDAMGSSGTCNAGSLEYTAPHAPFITRDYEC